MKTKIYLLFITTLFFCAGCGNKSGGQKQESVSAAKDTYVNPLFPEGADPSALFHNGKYIIPMQRKIRSCFGKRPISLIWLMRFAR